jgi:heat shock protein HslJ
VSGDSLSISGVRAGMKMCAGDISQQETAFLSALESAASFTMEMGLIISDGSGAVLEYVATGP